MADTFAALGLSDSIAAGVRTAGFDRPTPLQASAFSVLRRGANVVLNASSGAGVTAAWALPLLERLLEGDDASDAPRALVIAPTLDAAGRIATTLNTFAGDAGIVARPTLPGWVSAGADIIVTTAQRALADVQGSALKLESLQALVLTELSELLRLADADALGTLTGLVPRDAQRIVTSGILSSDAERFVDAQVRKAMTLPPRPADPAANAAPAAESLGQLGYITAPENDKAEILARLLDGVQERAVVYARSEQRAREVTRALEQRGIGSGNITVTSFDGDAGAAERIISFDIPASTEELRRLHSTGGTVMITAPQLPHLKRMAKEAPFILKLRRARELDVTELDEFRNSIRAAMASEDLTAQVLILDPLFNEFSEAEVAAALSSMLRKKVAAPVRSAVQSVAGAAPKEAQTGSGFTRLFISVGSRDNLRPGDVVGAITGEAGIKGDQVGRVDIRETFSVVEVMASVADKVIRALNGTTMRGRSLRVDYDRKGMGGGGDGPRGGGGPGGPRGGPRSDRPDRGDRPMRSDRPPPRGDRPPPRGDRPPPRGDRPMRPRRTD